MIESIKLFDIYLSSNILIVITESIGELKVLDNNLKQYESENVNS